jgi:glycosyltransferase involved in cell wall biosynthesis
MRKLRIAQVAPLFESVPPRHYGGTERIVSYLTEELVRLGHDVTLFASGDSKTKAHLVSVKDLAIRLDDACRDWVPHTVLLLEEVMERADEFDIVHFHTESLHLPIARRLGPACLTTMHGRLDAPDIRPLHLRFKEAPLVSISMAQRTPLPFAHWVGNVQHGLPLDLYGTPEEPTEPEYLLFLGRVSPEKHADAAIRIAKAVNIPLKIAAKVDRADEEYFRSVLCPMIEHPLIEFLGEVDDNQKKALLQKAIALILPIDWPEPFGLVMIEAMACGTPVIVRRRGSASEIIDHGKNGFLFESEEEAAAAIDAARALDRARCRKEFERRFSAPRMAADYAKIYREILASRASDRAAMNRERTQAPAPFERVVEEQQIE